MIMKYFHWYINHFTNGNIFKKNIACLRISLDPKMAKKQRDHTLYYYNNFIFIMCLTTVNKFTCNIRNKIEVSCAKYHPSYNLLLLKSSS